MGMAAGPPGGAGAAAFRNPLGAGFAAQPPTANLFSSIVLPEVGGMPLDSGESMGDGTEPGGGGGRGKRAAPDPDRSQAIQEKNRRAQKRFRERQVRSHAAGGARRRPPLLRRCRLRVWGWGLEEGAQHGCASPAPCSCQDALHAPAPRAVARARWALGAQKAKMKDMTEQLDEMSSELSRLRVENNALKNRNSILEKVRAPALCRRRCARAAAASISCHSCEASVRRGSKRAALCWCRRRRRLPGPA